MRCCRRFVSPPWQPHMMLDYISIIFLITIYMHVLYILVHLGSSPWWPCVMLPYVLISLTIINGDIINLHFLLYDHMCCSPMSRKSSWWNLYNAVLPLIFLSTIYESMLCLCHLTDNQSDATLSNHLDSMYNFILCIILLTITNEVMLYIVKFPSRVRLFATPWTVAH